MRVNDRVSITDRDGKPMLDGCGNNVIFRIAGVLEENGMVVYWLWLEMGDEYDGYDGTCVVQQLSTGRYSLTLADERSDIPRILMLVPVNS